MTNTNYRVFLYSSDVDRLTHEADFKTEDEAKACVEQWIGDREWDEQLAAGMFKIETRRNSHLRGKWHVRIVAKPAQYNKEMKVLIDKISMQYINKITESEVKQFHKELGELQAKQNKESALVIQGEFDVYETAILAVDRAIDNFLLESDTRLYSRIQREQRANDINERFMTDPKPFGMEIYRGRYAIQYKHPDDLAIEELRAIEWQPAGFNGQSGVQRFNVTSEALRVTDPCYSMDTWCAGQVENVKNGTWLSHVGFYHEERHEFDDQRWQETLANFEGKNDKLVELMEKLEGVEEGGDKVLEESELAGFKTIFKREAMRDIENYGNPDDWGGRVAYLHIRHSFEEAVPFNKDNFELTEIHVGVDSGQAGFFDLEKFKAVESGNGETKRRDGSPHEVFYEACGEQTLEGEGWGAVQGMGVVSSSGFGDGGYPLYVRRDEEGKIVEARIIYISDGEEEEDEEDGEE